MERVERVERVADLNADMPSLSVVVPAFNEEKAVGAEVTRLRDVLKQSGRPFEIIVVDDGSSDNTVDSAESAGARVVRHRVNRGYGAALKTGIRAAKGSVICITDADGTYPPEAVPKLVSLLVENQNDMVVGARVGSEAKIPLRRRPAKWVLNRLAELVAGEPIPDLNSGQRVFLRRTALRFFSLLPDGFSFTTTITLAMLNNGYQVRYEPISYAKRVGRSKIHPIRDTLGFTGLILRVALYFAPLKIFLPLSALLLAIALAWGLVSKFVLGSLADVSTVLLVLAAVQVAVVGLVAELINRRASNVYQVDE
jgi:glycosyltransferase involved in cell wall biosynthesis